jgi:hypothetical protein
MAAKKKAPAKKAPPPEQTQAGRSRAVDKLFDKLQSEWNKKHEGPIPVIRGSEASSSYLLRRPTGITSLDIALAGGFPGGTVSVLVGPDGVGKDFLFWTMAADGMAWIKFELESTERGGGISVTDLLSRVLDLPVETWNVDVRLTRLS